MSSIPSDSRMRRLHILSFLVLGLTLSTSLLAESSQLVFLEAKDAGIEFNIQGEYVGDQCAAQVIALGDGKFRIVGWGKGLPGTVEDAEKKNTVDAQTEGGHVVFDGGGWKGTIESGVLIGTDTQGRTHVLKRIVRESPTLGAKAPDGDTVLFDGTNTDAWVNFLQHPSTPKEVRSKPEAPDKPLMDERHLLFCGVKSKETFQDIHLHLEFLVPFMPKAKGANRGNSGVYIQDRYECQIVDSFGLEGAANETGGLYKIAKPKLNMCLPPLSWQTYDLDFESARYDSEGKKVKNAVLTSRLNGVVIHERVELPHTTALAGEKESPEPGPIYLQNHASPVFFRNIWIIESK